MAEGSPLAVENPLRGFPTAIYSLLRALVVRRGRTTRTLDRKCLNLFAAKAANSARLFLQSPGSLPWRKAPRFIKILLRPLIFSFE